MHAHQTSAPALVLLIAVGTVPAQDDSLLGRLSDLAAAAPLVVAHRGASSTHPENTLVAMRAAVEAGADVVEFDVYQTKDGKWVCFHDQTVDRTTDAVKKLGRKKAKIAELTFAEVRRLDAGSWFDARFAGERVPTLDEALAVVLPGAVPLVERKGGDPLALVQELRRLDRVDDVIVQAFDWDFLENVHAAEPGLLLGALGGDDLTAARRRDLVRTGAAMVHWSQRSLTCEAAAAVRASGHLLCAYTVNADSNLLGAVAIGCHLVTTDRPARMAELRRRGLLPPVVRPK